MDYIPAKKILTRNKSEAWFGCLYNMNLYRGCCHGCIYCDSRSDCYKIKDFDQVRAKENALMILRNDLNGKVKKGVIHTGSMSDPYNPLERELLLTRHGHELVSAYGFGISIATKSALITRDIDIFQEIKVHGPVLAKITITTVQDPLGKLIEPNVSLSSERFGAIRELSKAGIFTGVLMMPILPYINDTKENIIGIIEMAYENGAKFIYPAMGLTLRDSQREYFYGKLEQSFPGVREEYIKRFRNTYQCSSPKAKELYGILRKRCEKYGILYKMKDIISAYKLGYDHTQIQLF